MKNKRSLFPDSCINYLLNNNLFAGGITAKIRLSLLFFFALLSHRELQAQEINFSTLPPSLQIPFSECYNILEDSHGYIWICTEGGLYRYNGRETFAFKSPKGIIDGPVYCIFEDRLGVVRVITSLNCVLHVQNDSLIEEPWSKLYQAVIKENFIYTYHAHEAKDGCFILCTNSYTYQYNPKTNELKNLTLSSKEKSVNIELYSNDKETFLIRKIISTPTRLSIRVKALGKDTILTYTFQNQHLSPPNYRIQTCRIKNTLFLNWSNVLIQINVLDFSSRVRIMPGIISSLTCDKKSGLFVGVFLGGLYYFKNIQNMDEFTHSLKDFSVVSIVLDREKGLWCSTTDKGIFYSYTPFVYYFPQLTTLLKPVSLLKVYEDSLFVSGDGHSLLIFNSSNKLVASKEIFFSPNDIFRQGNLWYAGGSGSPMIRLNKHLKPETPSAFITSCFQFASLNDEIVGLSKRRFFIMKGNRQILMPPRFSSSGRCFMLLADSTFILGCDNGLYTGRLGLNSIRKIPGINSRVNKLLRTRNGNVWIATRNQGLFLWNGKGAIKFPMESDQLLDEIKDIEEGNNNTIWVGTHKGLFSISQTDTLPGIATYTSINGLLSDDIRQIAVGKKYVYLSTPEGICFFNPEDELLKGAEPEIIFKAQFINGVESPPGVIRTDLKYNENSLRFTFDVPGLKQNVPSYPLEIQIKGPINITNRIDKNVVELTNLLPGSYQLKIWTVNNQGEKRSKSLSYFFTIQRIYWQKPWFIILMFALSLILLGLLICLILRTINRKVLKKKENEMLILGLQLSALQSQMNPHFIFNAINSIQNFILKEKSTEADNYLIKFGKLIRMVLHNSRDHVLCLSTDLETISLYVQLEQLRFKERFDFHLELDESILPDNLLIPSMLVQPFIENAIWHGLMNLKSERKGQLHLHISKEMGCLKIIIEDNGIGRKAAGLLTVQTIHKSIGLKITEQRLAIIRTMKGYEQTAVDVIDVYDVDGNSSGTKVILTLPVIPC